MDIASDIASVPLWNWSLQVLGLLTAYVGAELNARRRIEGFYLWLASNIVLGALHALTDLWVLLILDLLFFRVNALAVVRWAREAPEQTPPWLNRLINKLPPGFAS